MPEGAKDDGLPSMIDQIAEAIARADGGDIQVDGPRYRRLAMGPPSGRWRGRQRPWWMPPIEPWNSMTLGRSIAAVTSGKP